MEKEALKRIFEFLEEKENHNLPFLWKLVNNEPLTEDDLNIKGDLDLSYLDIASLPEGLKVSGGLDLAGCKQLTSLPEGLKVGGSLYLQYSKIKSLPEGLEVGGFIFKRNTPLEKYSDNELREMIKPGFIKGEIR